MCIKRLAGIVLGFSLIATAAWAGEPASTRTGMVGSASPRVALPDFGTVITFSEFPSGTAITNQYANKGIVFGGDAPFITGDGAHPTSPVLSGSPLFNGAIEGSFVNKTNGRPVDINGFTFDAGFFDSTGSVRVTLYDIDGNIILRRRNTKLGIETFNFTNVSNVHKFRIEIIAAENAGFSIDNVSFGERVNLVKNGSFEEPLAPSGSFTTYSIGQPFGYWRVIGDANPTTNNVALVRGNLSTGGFTFPARKGDQWLDLTGTSNKPTGVFQAIETTPGQCYELTFYVGNVNNPGGPFGVRSWVNVSFDGVHYNTAKNSDTSSPNTQVWQKFTRVVKAVTSKARLMFINADPFNDSSNGLDDVVLAPTAGPC